MNAMEARATWSLASLFVFRMLGLFMVLPVFALYGQELAGATPFLIGLAIGAYGFSQALLQVPFGYLSDRFGRKPMILLGLFLFLIGSVVAALSTSIEGVILGRILQGTGAIAGPVMALLSDLTREDQRTKAMALVGASIGLSFSLALITGPAVAGWFELGGVFWLTALMALVGMALTLWVVPTPPSQRIRSRGPFKDQFRAVLRQTELLRLNLGVFLLHMTMTALFVVLPPLLVGQAQLDKNHHWQIYLPVLCVSFVLMIPLMILAERRQMVKQVFLTAIALLVTALLMLARWHDSLLAILMGLLVYFWAFNLLEAMLPSLVSKVVAPALRGTSMGIYSTTQFLGAGAGGAVGGYLLGHNGMSFVLELAAALVCIWLLVAAGMRQPRKLQDYTLPLDHFDFDAVESASLVRRLLRVSGVEDVVVIPHEKAAYLKVDNQCLDKEQLRAVAAAAH
ncbi:MAG TPA: MFS transporter [Dongiaceae bacterium]|nr:MFS transporter [Dongiaceae bacterium]